MQNDFETLSESEFDENKLKLPKGKGKITGVPHWNNEQSMHDDYVTYNDIEPYLDEIEENWAYTPPPPGYRDLPRVEPLPKKHKHHETYYTPETPFPYSNDEIIYNKLRLPHG